MIWYLTKTMINNHLLDSRRIMCLGQMTYCTEQYNNGSGKKQVFFVQIFYDNLFIALFIY